MMLRGGRDGLFTKRWRVCRITNIDGLAGEVLRSARSGVAHFAMIFPGLKLCTLGRDGRLAIGQAEQWWIEFRKLRIAESTQNSERYRLQHLEKILGNLRLREITNRHLDDYTTARLAAGIGADSINKETRLWSLVLQKAKLWKRLAEDYKPLKTRAGRWLGRAHDAGRVSLVSLYAAATDVDWEAAFATVLFALWPRIPAGGARN